MEKEIIISLEKNVNNEQLIEILDSIFEIDGIKYLSLKFNKEEDEEKIEDEIKNNIANVISDIFEPKRNDK